MGLGGIKLAEYADPRAVSRGVGIAANAASIVDRRVRRSDDVSVVTGRVASASGIADYFNVDVVFADFESRIIDYDCDCPAAARFDGMCKPLRGADRRLFRATEILRGGVRWPRCGFVGAEDERGAGAVLGSAPGCDRCECRLGDRGHGFGCRASCGASCL